MCGWKSEHLPVLFLEQHDVLCVSQVENTKQLRIYKSFISMPTPPVQYLSLMMFHKARCMPLLSLVVFNIHQDAIDSFCASAGWRSVPPMPNLAGTTYCRIHQQSRCLPECDCHQLQTLILVENSADSADSILYSLRAPS